MEFVRGLQGERKETVYSIKGIRFACDVQYYSIPPDETRRERYRPRLIIDLEGRPDSGGFEYHSARLVMNSDELRKLSDALGQHLLDSFHASEERKHVNERETANAEENQKPPDAASAA
jgi:hypothetical protein